MAQISLTIIECASKHRRYARSFTQTGVKGYLLGFVGRVLHIVNYRSHVQTIDV